VNKIVKINSIKPVL